MRRSPMAAAGRDQRLTTWSWLDAMGARPTERADLYLIGPEKSSGPSPTAWQATSVTEAPEA